MFIHALNRSGTLPLEIKDEYHHLRVWCEPANSPAGDWSLRDLQSPLDAHKPQAERLGAYLKQHGITRAFAPNVSAMSGRVDESELLSATILLPHKVHLHRNKEEPLDGVPLEVGQAFLMSGGGCPLALIYGEGVVIAAHASRDSLFDRMEAQGGPRSRKQYGVVSTAVEYLKRRQKRIEEMRLWVGFGIDPSVFVHPHDDPEHGEKNRAMERYLRRNWGGGIMTGSEGAIDTHLLAIEQAKHEGFKEAVSGPFLPLDGPFGYTRHTEPGMRQARNLVVVHRIA